METPFLAGLSIRSSGGYIVGERNARGWGPLLELNRNGTATEAQLEDLNRGLSIGGGGGFIAGSDATTPITNDPADVPIAVEPGLYSPQLGGGFNFNFLFWDATDNGYDFKWPWEK